MQSMQIPQPFGTAGACLHKVCPPWGNRSPPLGIRSVQGNSQGLGLRKFVGGRGKGGVVPHLMNPPPRLCGRSLRGGRRLRRGAESPPLGIRSVQDNSQGLGLRKFVGGRGKGGVVLHLMNPPPRLCGRSLRGGRRLRSVAKCEGFDAWGGGERGV